MAMLGGECSGCCGGSDEGCFKCHQKYKDWQTVRPLPCAICSDDDYFLTNEITFTVRCDGLTRIGGSYLWSADVAALKNWLDGLQFTVRLSLLAGQYGEYSFLSQNRPETSTVFCGTYDSMSVTLFSQWATKVFCQAPSDGAFMEIGYSGSGGIANIAGEYADGQIPFFRLAAPSHRDAPAICGNSGSFPLDSFLGWAIGPYNCPPDGVYGGSWIQDVFYLSGQLEYSRIIVPGGITGSCCYPDGSCTEGLASNCYNRRGRFTPSASCQDAQCPTYEVEQAGCSSLSKEPDGIWWPIGDCLADCEKGACCETDGSCSIKTVCECDTENGAVFAGEGETCEACAPCECEGLEGWPETIQVDVGISVGVVQSANPVPISQACEQTFRQVAEGWSGTYTLYHRPLEGQKNGLYYFREVTGEFSGECGGDFENPIQFQRYIEIELDQCWQLISNYIGFFSGDGCTEAPWLGTVAVVQFAGQPAGLDTCTFLSGGTYSVSLLGSMGSCPWPSATGSFNQVSTDILATVTMVPNPLP